jgi:hypothetical protein
MSYIVYISISLGLHDFHMFCAVFCFLYLDFLEIIFFCSEGMQLGYYDTVITFPENV